MRKRRRGRIFQRNKETISVTLYNVRTHIDDIIADDVECVWHPNVAPIQYQDSVPILDADWEIVLKVPNSDINKTHTPSTDRTAQNLRSWTYCVSAAQCICW